MQLHQFADNQSLLVEMVKRIKGILIQAIKSRGQAYLVVSGGKTPLELFEKLSSLNIDWSKVKITLADERCLALADENRNEKMVRDHLLINQAQEAHFISLYHENSFSLASIEQQIAKLPTFDIVILGMGEDGHTASLFPCAPDLKDGMNQESKAVCFINPTTAPFKRISMSMDRLHNARHHFLQLKGKKKLAILEVALKEKDSMRMPISGFLNDSKTNVQVMYAP